MNYRELAKKLGISPASLSLIVNRKPGISKATRDRVAKELKDMGYGYLLQEEDEATQPDTFIYFIVYHRSGYIIGDSPFVYLLNEHVDAAAKQHGYRITVKSMHYRSDVAREIEEINDSGASGVLIMATEMLDEDIHYFEKLHIPFVAIDHDFTALNINTVAINNQMGTYQAVEHLVNMGHTDIGYLHTTEYISSWSERAFGFRQAMMQFSLPLSDDKIFRVRYRGGKSYDDFLQILESGVPLPTAFVTDDDVTAVGVIRALQEYGYHIPEDISIVGFNDRPVCQHIVPKLTSIDVPKYDFGSEGVDALVSLIEKKKQGNRPERAVKRRITTQLVERDSVCRIEGRKKGTGRTRDFRESDRFL